ncbi:MAG: HDOD domain-containing protein [Reinekea sp.]
MVLPQPNAPVDDWMNIIREDPLLTIHLFIHANKMLASNNVSVRTLEQAISLLGTPRLRTLAGKIPRVEEKSASAKGLLRAIGDSLLASSLLRQWFQMRQIPWTETDYWFSLFYDLSIWVGWLLEPEQMENVEFRVQQGENRDQLMQKIIGMPVRDFNEMLCQYFQLPVLPSNESVENKDLSRIQPFKQSALKFFLPFSHELAFAVRQNWHSQSLDALCRKGEVSLGLPEFKTMLRQWVTVAAREFKLSYAAISARHLMVIQPHSGKTGLEGFSPQDQALAQQLSSQESPRNQTQENPPLPDIDAWPEANLVNTKQETKPANKNGATKTLNFSSSSQRPGVNISLQHEIRSQFRNQRSWHSPVEIQESALYGLQHGLHLSRLVVMEEQNGFWQTFDTQGCQEYPLLRNLKLTTLSSGILTELSKRVTALWVNDANRSRADKLLPPPLITASENESFFFITWYPV